MKHLIVFLSGIFFLSCQSDDKVLEKRTSFLGKWQLVEMCISPGGGGSINLKLNDENMLVMQAPCFEVCRYTYKAI
jgi:hypothetical protein